MNKIWYAIYTKSHCEKKINAELEKRKIESFLPLYKRVSKWADRKKIIYEPLFKGYLFVCINIKDVLNVLKLDGVVNLVGKKENGYSYIPCEQIETMKIILSKEEVFDPYPYLNVGQMVRVVRGPLKGSVGKLIRKKNIHRIVVSIDIIKQSVAADIDSEMVEAY